MKCFRCIVLTSQYSGNSLVAFLLLAYSKGSQQTKLFFCSTLRMGVRGSRDEPRERIDMMVMGSRVKEFRDSHRVQG